MGVTCPHAHQVPSRHVGNFSVHVIEATVMELNLFWWKLRKNSTLGSFVTVCFH